MRERLLAASRSRLSTMVNFISAGSSVHEKASFDMALQIRELQKWGRSEARKERRNGEWQMKVRQDRPFIEIQTGS